MENVPISHVITGLSLALTFGGMSFFSAIMAPLVILTILFGFYPAPILDVTAVSVKHLVNNYEAAIQTTTALVAQ